MRPTNWQVHLIQLLAVPGMLLAYYLLLYHNGDLIAVCPAGGWEDCGQVSGPDALYSSIGPMPVALIGLIGYALIFLTIWLKDWSSLVDDYLPEIILGLTALAFLFSLGLTALEAFVLHVFCRFCLVSAAIVTTMFGLAISYLRQTTVN
jgi:uncharacterized membrane protein